MSAKLTAFIAQLELAEKSVPGVLNAGTFPPTIGNMPYALNLLEPSPIDAQKLPGRVTMRYTFGIALLCGTSKQAPAAWQTVLPLIQPFMAALSKDPTFRNATIDAPTCVNSYLDEQVGFSNAIPYRDDKYSGLIFKLVVTIHEPTTV